MITTILVISGIFLCTFCVWKTFQYFHRIKISFRESLGLTGLPIVSLNIEGHLLNFIVDTGSSTSVINKKVVDEFHLTYEFIKNTAHLGIEGVPIEVPKGSFTVDYNNKTYKLEAIVREATDSFNAIAKHKGIQIHGLLGSDFFHKYKYIIDFQKYLFYTK